MCVNGIYLSSDGVTKFVCHSKLVGFGLIFTAVIVLSIFVFIESVRLYQPINWIVSFVIVSNWHINHILLQIRIVYTIHNNTFSKIEGFISSVSWLVCVTCPKAMGLSILVSILTILLAIIIGFFTAVSLYSWN